MSGNILAGRDAPILVSHKINKETKMTELQGSSTRPHHLELMDRLIAAPDSETRMAILARNKAKWPPVTRPRPVMPPHDKVRREITQLMPRHLDWVERLANRPGRGKGSPGRPEYDRSSMQQLFSERWNSYFQPLRGSKIKDVPSDEFWRSWMIRNLLDLVDERRRQIEEAKQPISNQPTANVPAA